MVRTFLVFLLTFAFVRAGINDVDDQGKTDLLKAAFNGDLDRVRDLLQQGADPTILDHNKCNALIWALEFNHKDVVQELLKNPNVIANLEHENVWGFNALMLAAKHDDGENLNTLLDHGANINFKSSGKQTAVSRSIILSKQNTLKILLDRGVDLSQEDFILAKDNDVILKLIVDTLKQNRMTEEQRKYLTPHDDLGIELDEILSLQKIDLPLKEIPGDLMKKLQEINCSISALERDLLSVKESVKSIINSTKDAFQARIQLQRLYQEIAA